MTAKTHALCMCLVIRIMLLTRSKKLLKIVIKNYDNSARSALCEIISRSAQLAYAPSGTGLVLGWEHTARARCARLVKDRELVVRVRPSVQPYLRCVVLDERRLRSLRSRSCWRQL